ncbi:1-acyl-sn-glycerol-3-phosphate acyltransferase [Actinotalea sp. BY-33]|uniref:1-acyl-sn-glycerol-3-phosphate acyltransferase n=1 Tax=Actinotalea soli TaxID=2819234 RepID=A0A939RXC5_9CELL|nr:1-acyl-sn-glycerol-3-phosphate acyltransferase [Actinotalea soli]MBO1753086.1 1-acyl-sn-glycerol-3-phosphate acyltransferase [Actinotalea soli]
MPVRRTLARLLFRLSGWRAVGDAPRSGLFIGAPHTSNWDFVLTLMVLWNAEVKPRMLVKRELFWWPLGPVLRGLGAVPTDRRGAGGLVQRLVEEAAGTEDFVLVIAAEGTRRRTDHWKTGFYRLALGTGLPLTLGFVDGPTRTAGVGETFVVTGDVRADMDRIRAFYADKHGVRPERAGTPRLREEEPDGPAV